MQATQKCKLSSLLIDKCICFVVAQCEQNRRGKTDYLIVNKSMTLSVENVLTYNK
jgi:hypothetical protein